MGIIEIDKTKIPYSFDILLSNRVYTLNINYNILFDFFTADLLLNGNVLAKNEKLVLGQFLFREIAEDSEHNINPNFPTELLYIGTSDNKVQRLGFENLGTNVFLYCIQRSEVNESAS
jgi:hypothetical protein